jgi:hypothetical protein
MLNILKVSVIPCTTVSSASQIHYVVDYKQITTRVEFEYGVMHQNWMSESSDYTSKYIVNVIVL